MVNGSEPGIKLLDDDTEFGIILAPTSIPTGAPANEPNAAASKLLIAMKCFEMFVDL
jgi:hypothetical protein